MAGAWHTRMTLGKLLWLDGVAGLDGVVFSGAGCYAFGLSILPTLRRLSLGLLFSFISIPS